MRPHLTAPLILLVCMAASVAPAQTSAPVVAQQGTGSSLDTLLSSGRAEEACQTFAAAVERRSDDYNARFALGFARLVHSVEQLGQKLHSYGLQPNPVLNWLGMLGMIVPNWPIPANDHPQEISYEDARRLVSDVLDDLREIDAILAKIPPDADVRLPLHFGLIRLDLDGNGRADESESLWRIATAVMRTPALTALQANELVVAFDRADVEWLRGYVHLLSALCECTLAYDERELFERTAQLVLPRPKTPYALPPSAANGRRADEGFLDLVALIHLMSFPVAEPPRMEAARQHLLQMLTHSERMIKMASDETDDDHEWIPSPRQTSAFMGLRINGAMFAGWETFITEARDLLEGHKLIPFWRGAGSRGVNLKRVFAEPRRFDLVLWMQGTAAVPYLEEGECTSPETWQRLQEIFEGRFWTYAAWIN